MGKELEAEYIGGELAPQNEDNGAHHEDDDDPINFVRRKKCGMMMVITIILVIWMMMMFLLRVETILEGICGRAIPNCMSALDHGGCCPDSREYHFQEPCCSLPENG